MNVKLTKIWSLVNKIIREVFQDEEETFTENGFKIPPEEEEL